jgi:hypothetical protein
MDALVEGARSLAGDHVRRPERGPGARMSWVGQRLGFGSLTLTQVHPAGGVEYELQFRGVDQGTKGALRIAAEPAGSRLTWSDGGELGWNPMMRLFAPSSPPSSATTSTSAWPAWPPGWNRQAEPAGQRRPR